MLPLLYPKWWAADVCPSHVRRRPTKFRPCQVAQTEQYLGGIEDSFVECWPDVILLVWRSNTKTSSVTKLFSASRYAVGHAFLVAFCFCRIQLCRGHSRAPAVSARTGVETGVNSGSSHRLPRSHRIHLTLLSTHTWF